jgi:hypothetical protein
LHKVENLAKENNWPSKSDPGHTKVTQIFKNA